jgi:hypothetical protein
MANLTALLAINAVFTDSTGALKSAYCTVQNDQGQRMKQSLRVDARNLHCLPKDILAGVVEGAAFIADIPLSETGAIIATKSASSAIVLGAPLSNAHSFKGFAERTEATPDFEPAPVDPSVEKAPF